MKQLIFRGGIFTLALATILFACKKEEVKTTEVFTPVDTKVGLTTDGKILKFATLEDYEKAVDHEQQELQEDMLAAIKSVKFKNYATLEQVNQPTTDKSKGQEMDDFLAQLLNVDGAVQIQDHIYKVDLAKEKVFVIKAEDRATHYQDLIHGNISNKAVSEYSVTENVLMVVNGNDDEKCAGFEGVEFFTVVNVNSSNQFRCVVKVFTAGIYFRVTGRTVKVGNNSFNFQSNYELVPTNTEIKRKPCSNNEVTIHYPGIKKTMFNEADLVWEMYAKAWNVKALKVNAKSTIHIYGENATLTLVTPVLSINL